MTIKRYWHDEAWGASEADDGPYCLSTDVDKLEARIEELEKALNEGLEQCELKKVVAGSYGHLAKFQELAEQALQREG